MTCRDRASVLAHALVTGRWWIAGLWLAGLACGPIRSQSVLIDAATELTAAEVAGGAQRSPYEFIAAESYLRKAREEQSYADFEAAENLAEKARICAKLARRVAELATRAELSGAPSPAVEKRGCRAGGRWLVADDSASLVDDSSPPIVPPSAKTPIEPRPEPKAKTRAPGEPADPDEAPLVPPKKKVIPVEPPEELPPGEDLPPGEEPEGASE
ncbi:MAG: DUF4398 domain-containing protein [Deltaproteobacteria bacterium]|nr:DUF4398 domain-containing protein [Deltaproteobacteria bacterium]